MEGFTAQSVEKPGSGRHTVPACRPHAATAEVIEPNDLGQPDLRVDGGRARPQPEI